MTLNDHEQCLNNNMRVYKRLGR